MDNSIRHHIINNFQGDDFSTLRKAIDESVKAKDEVTLPGLGVFLGNNMGKLFPRIKK